MKGAECFCFIGSRENQILHIVPIRLVPFTGVAHRFIARAFWSPANNS
jgi:hypothetical protein